MIKNPVKWLDNLAKDDYEAASEPFHSNDGSSLFITATPGAPVSTPLEWKEVPKGDLWKGIFANGMDMKKSLRILESLGSF